MNREILVDYTLRLAAAMASRGGAAVAEIGSPASAHELSECESATGVRVRGSYRASLESWNGVDIKLYESAKDVASEGWFGRFEVGGTRRVVRLTRTVRSTFAYLARDRPELLRVQEYSRHLVALSNQDDLAVVIRDDLVGAGDERPVAYVDMQYFSERPAEPFANIAQSFDEYLVRALEHLIETQRDEIYW